MLRTAASTTPYGRGLALQRLRRRSRSVLVRVINGGREVDSFLVSDSQTLRSALRPIQLHLPEKSGVVQFKGFEEEWLPLGVDRVSRQVDLESLGAAMSYLAA